ncbi:MAG: response regulator of the arsR family protein [Candidatus Scalindua rubra]|uniref:Response regulator of the arsR family protein n=1 Tax=Candidatus Scalindua rubra TaxID=1872076 RepID=A0A1E3X7V4_9BACT|nr:MAG: response regulator of the arsR family protein [Candidatus Scalindua rubra]
MENHVEMFKALSDKTRIRIMRLLIDSGTEICGCEFVDSLEESQYNISRHMKVLKHAGLIKERKEGRWVYYSVTDRKDSFKKMLYKLIGCIPEDIVKNDQKRFKKRLDIRVKGKCLLGIQNKRFAKTQ